MGNLLNRLDLLGRMVERKPPHQSYFCPVLFHASLMSESQTPSRNSRNYQAQIKGFYVRPFCIQGHGSICENNIQ